MTDKFAFGDQVKIKETAETLQEGIAGLEGTIYGFTVPSASGATAVGALSDDFAFNVYVDSLDQDFWLDPSNIEFTNRPEVMEIDISGKTIRITQKDGEYKEEIISPRPWWKFW